MESGVERIAVKTRVTRAAQATPVCKDAGIMLEVEKTFEDLLVKILSFGSNPTSERLQVYLAGITVVMYRVLLCLFRSLGVLMCWRC